jgi:hypothetical protein
LKLTDAQRKAMFHRLSTHKHSEFHIRKLKDNDQMYGKDESENKLYRKFQREDRLVKQHGSMENYSKFAQNKRSESYHKAGVTRQRKANEKYDAKIIAKYGSKENYFNQRYDKLKAKQDEIERIKASPKLLKANQNFAITGSKYYKQTICNLDNKDAPYCDSIHCPNCSQRLGNSIDPCPICPKESRHDHYGASVYGSMLKNPSDKRWLLPKYNKSKFAPNENSSAEFHLNERRSNAGNLDDLK